ncbi:MAG: hypothetical protein IT371_30005 [Deltaproteobacteria bacterium]|nr:hypothetical protein [Deltaproteobacteria bacterium]
MRRGWCISGVMAIVLVLASGRAQASNPIESLAQFVYTVFHPREWPRAADEAKWDLVSTLHRYRYYPAIRRASRALEVRIATLGKSRDAGERRLAGSLREARALLMRSEESPAMQLPLPLVQRTLKLLSQVGPGDGLPTVGTHEQVFNRLSFTSTDPKGRTTEVFLLRDMIGGLDFGKQIGRFAERAAQAGSPFDLIQEVHHRDLQAPRLTRYQFRIEEHAPARRGAVREVWMSFDGVIKGRR